MCDPTLPPVGSPIQPRPWDSGHHDMAIQRSSTHDMTSLLGEHLRDHKMVRKYLSALGFELPADDEWDLEKDGFPTGRIRSGGGSAGTWTGAVASDSRGSTQRASRRGQRGRRGFRLR